MRADAGGLRRRRNSARAVEPRRSVDSTEEDAAFASIRPFGRRLPRDLEVGSMSVSTEAEDELTQRFIDGGGSLSMSYTACLTEADCLEASQKQGIQSFWTGDFPSKGCVTKNDKAFFSPGTEGEMSEVDLPGIRERLWC